MGNKTYNQYCAIASALDLIGERWSLLIIRNLLAGSKRFSDLMKGLPGISTNILTNRLKSLEDHAIITTAYLPPPAASTVYQLTAQGRGLIPALSALAQWGALHLDAPEERHQIVPESVIFMIYGVFMKPASVAREMTIVLNVDAPHHEQAYTVTLSQDGVQVNEVAVADADVSITLGLQALLQASSGQVSVQSLLAEEKLIIDGEQSAIDDLLGYLQ
ncbi:MAG: winged helix-turn-helix transcriptional regulator [Chloroflexota bacterium]